MSMSIINILGFMQFWGSVTHCESPLAKPVAEGGLGGSAPPAGNKIEIVPHQTKICSCLF